MSLAVYGIDVGRYTVGKDPLDGRKGMRDSTHTQKVNFEKAVEYLQDGIDLSRWPTISNYAEQGY